MLSAIALIPSPPVLVPELAGGAAAELTDLRDAVVSAVAELPPRWVAVGVADADIEAGPQTVGTFAGYGVDLRVTLSPGAAGEPSALPLCALIAGWVRGAARTDASVEVRAYAAGHDADAAVRHGRRLRARIEEATDPVGVLVIADGLNTLTPSAPGGHEPDSVPVQAALDDALAAGDAAALTRLPSAVIGRVAYQVLAGLAETPRSAKELYRGAPYGVGYFAGVWKP
ncbi:hypothetical protein SAMN04489835_4765 [Mycolicibacterium rutilum]|uniref:Uncharacterized protein n=1 Tax=Mycolicibacterium rutilum TaxID=370526 RepID=A0A1H6LHR3_MYCRU|nr:hypothetical protein [Mycolicibacterium rutilum]SEH84119.1 hypothetical protein SAMN04489835_4765 [Mycolicibacterium rutilum]